MVSVPSGSKLALAILGDLTGMCPGFPGLIPPGVTVFQPSQNRPRAFSHLNGWGQSPVSTHVYRIPTTVWRIIYTGTL